MTEPQNQPTDPPPVTTPPADNNPPATPPAQKPPVVVQSGQFDASPLLAAIGAIPEKVANAVREQIPQTPPAQSPKAGDQSTGGNTQQTPTKAPQQAPAAPAQAATTRRSFAEWWHGKPRNA